MLKKARPARPTTRGSFRRESILITSPAAAKASIGARKTSSRRKKKNPASRVTVNARKRTAAREIFPLRQSPRDTAAPAAPKGARSQFEERKPARVGPSKGADPSARLIQDNSTGSAGFWPRKTSLSRERGDT